MSKREEEKAIEDTKKVAEEAKRVEDKIDAVETLQEVAPQVAAQEFQSTINKSLDETKKNVKKSIDESRNQIPQYTNVIKNYQEQALESTGKMVENYIETQKSVINSVFHSAIPYMKTSIECITIGSHQEFLQKYGPDRLAILQKTFQQR